MSDDMIYVGLELTVRHVHSDSGLFVGFLREFPFITGQAESLEKLDKQLVGDLDIYFRTFPEQGTKMLSKYGKVIGKNVNIDNEIPQPLPIERPELGEGWLETKVAMTITPTATKKHLRFVEIIPSDKDVLFFQHADRRLYCLRKYERGLDINQVQVMCQLLRLPFTEFIHLYEQAQNGNI